MNSVPSVLNSESSPSLGHNGTTGEIAGAGLPKSRLQTGIK